MNEEHKCECIPEGMSPTVCPQYKGSNYMNLKEEREKFLVSSELKGKIGEQMLDTLLKHSQQQLLESLSNYIDHEEDCIRNHFEAGEPTENGYRQRFKGKWYEARPIDKTPKCDCGLDEALNEVKALI